MPNTIESVIRINGGQTVPDTLYSRELFITPDGTLYVGEMTANGGDTPNADCVGVKVLHANVSTALQNDADGGTFIDLPGFVYRRDRDLLHGTAEFSSGSSVVGNYDDSSDFNTYSSLKRFNIKDCSIDLDGLKFKPTTDKKELEVTTAKFTSPGSVTLEGSVFIGEKNYGYTLPTDGTRGQIFFQIVE